jgi:hypothetical protein
MSFLWSLRSKYDHYLPCVLNLFLYFHTNQHTSKNSKSCNANAPHRALTTRFTQKNRPQSKLLFFHYLLNNLSRRTIASTERGDRLRQFGQGRRTRRFTPFERTRSLDECRVAVRSRKVDFLSGNARHCVVELMCVARYCVYVSTSARFTFATNAGFFS